MISLAEEMVPNGFEEETLDFGFVQRPSSGAALLRVDRPGARLKVKLTFPPMRPDEARRVLPRLKRAVREGLRVQWPLVDVSQGLPGSPVVDGTPEGGTSLPVRGLAPGYVAKVGYVLHIEEAATGARYLHQLQATAVADAAGAAVFDIEPPLRAPFADGDAIELAQPTIEGLLAEAPGSSINLNRLVYGTALTIEEAR